MGASGILAAKTLTARCIGDHKELEQLALKVHQVIRRPVVPARAVLISDLPDDIDQRKLRGFLVRCSTFAWRFQCQLAGVVILIGLALGLLVAGLVILLFKDQKQIGTAVFASITGITALFWAPFLRDLWTELRLKFTRGICTHGRRLCCEI